MKMKHAPFVRAFPLRYSACAGAQSGRPDSQSPGTDTPGTELEGLGEKKVVQKSESTSTRHRRALGSVEEHILNKLSMSIHIERDGVCLRIGSNKSFCLLSTRTKS